MTHFKTAVSSLPVMMLLSLSLRFTPGLNFMLYFSLSLSPQDLDGLLGISVCLFVSAVQESTGTLECTYHASNQSTWTNGPPSRYKYVCLYLKYFPVLVA